MKRSSMFLVCLFFALTLAVFAADKKLVVAAGETAAAAQPAESTLTLAALEQGKGTFDITIDGQKYTIDLSEEQVKDALAGTTVIVDAGDAHKVTITVKEAKVKKSGW